MSKTSSVVYIAGNFTEVNGEPDSAGFVGLNNSGAVVVNRPDGTNSRANLTCNDLNYCTQMYDVEATAQGDVWITGVEHATYQIDEQTLQVKTAHLTYRGPACVGLSDEERSGIPECRSPGGDGQELYVAGNRVYALCHCFGGVHSTTNTDDMLLVPGSWSSTPVLQNGYVKPVSGVIAFNANTGAVDTGFNPFMAGTSGGFSVLEDSQGCLWVTGHFSQVGQPGVEATAPGRNLVRLCDDGVAPTLSGPTNCAVVVDGDNVTVTWNAAQGALGYRIYRSIDGGSDFWQGRVDGATQFETTLSASGPQQYSVEAVITNSISSERTLCGSPVGPG